MGAEAMLSAKHYLDEAKNSLEKKEFVKFISNISSAILLAKSELFYDGEILEEATYLKVKGLVAFRQYEDVQDTFNEVVSYVNDEKLLRLKRFLGIAKGYLGEVQQAKRIFEEILQTVEATDLLVGTYLNLLWVNLSLEKNKDSKLLNDAKVYLDKISDHLLEVSTYSKYQYYQYLSLYYFHIDECEKAIEFLERSLEFCPEVELANAYVNLAEYYFHFYDNGIWDEALEYLEKAESIATKYNDYLDLGNTFYTQAKFEIRDGNYFTALDSLYLSLAHFKEANDHLKSLECLSKIDDIEAKCKKEGLTYLIEGMKDSLKKKSLDKKILKEELV